MRPKLDWGLSHSHTKDSVTLSFRYILRLWLPLMATWLLMAVSYQIVATMVATLPDPKVNLAAFGIASAIGLIVEAPIVMMTNAASALCQDQQRYRLVFRNNLILNLIVTVIMAVLSYPPLFDWMAGSLMGIEANVVDSSRTALIWLVPWPAAIGMRRFYQGIALSSGAVRQITISGTARVLATGLACLGTSKSGLFSGAEVGCAGLTAGVVAEWLAVRFIARRTIRQVAHRRSEGEPLTQKVFWKFYYPLIITAYISLGTEPIVTFFLGRSVASIESLAVLPVIGTFIFAFASFSLALQDATVAMLGMGAEATRKVAKFALAMSALLAILIWALAYTPLVDLWLTDIAGLTPELATFARMPLRIAAPIPIISMLFCYLVAGNIHRHRTAKVTLASASEALIIVTIAWLGLSITKEPGALIMTTALLLGRLASTGYLAWQNQVDTNRLARVAEHQLD